MKNALTGPQRSAFRGKSRQLIIAVAALLLSYAAIGQTRTNIQRIETPYSWRAMEARNLMYLPQDTVSTADSGSIAYLDGRMWLKKELKWVDLCAKQISDSSFVFGGDTIVIRGTAGGGGSGTVNSGTQYRLAYYAANGTAVSENAAITGSRALASNANGLPVATAVTNTELGYVSGVTSGIQTQLNDKLWQVDSDTTITGNGTALLPAKVNIKYIANVYSVDTAALTPFGTYFSDQTFTGTLASMNYTATGLTATVGSGRVRLSNGNNDNLRRLYKNNTLIGTQYWKDTASITIDNTPSATTYGISIGRDGGPLLGKIDLTTNASAGRIYLYFGSTEMANSGGTVLSFSNGDTLIMVLEQRNDSVFFSARNKTTNSATIKVGFKYLFAFGTTIQMSSGGAHGVYLHGGEYYLNNFTTELTSPRHPSIIVVADSKGEGQWAGSKEARWVQKLNDFYAPVVNYSNSGAAIANFILRLPELIPQDAKQAIIAIGSNSLRQGVPEATWKQEYVNFVDSLTAHGWKLYHIVIWEQAGDLTPLHNFISTTYPNDYIGGVWSTTQACGTACLVGDNVHPNARGNDSVYTAIVRDGRILRGDFRQNANYISLDNIGTNTTNPSAKVLVDNYGRIEKSDPSVLLNGSFIKQNGNAFAAPVQIGSTDNQDVRILRNNRALVRFLEYPFQLSLHDQSGDGVFSIRADSLENMVLGMNGPLGYGFSNVLAIGHGAASGKTSQGSGVYIGKNAGAIDQAGLRDTYVGFNAAPSNRGSFSVAVGSYTLGAGVGLATSDQTTAVGDGNLYGLTTGDNNSGLGFGSGQNLTTGSRSIIIGSQLAFRSATEDGQINVGGLFWGKNATATGSSAAGLAGIANNNPAVTLHIGGTDAVGINGGTTAQRPTGAAGYIRWNTDSTAFEGYDGSAWKVIATRDWVKSNTLSNPMTTTADLIVGGVAGSPTRLAPGTANQILGMSSGATAHEYKTVTEGTGIDVTHSSGSLTVAVDMTVINNAVKDSTGYYTITGTTTDATPTSLAVIALPNTSMTTIEATCIAIKNDGTSGFSAVKLGRYMKDNVPALLSGSSDIVADAYSGAGLSTATFTLTNSGTSAAIQVTGEAATTIQWKIRYKILQTSINL